MLVEFTIQTVRELKGAALSIVALLSLTTLPVTQEWLERNSGYTDKPVSQALAYLRETGRVCKTSEGWVLATGVQMALPVSRNFSDSIININRVVDAENDSEGPINNNRSRNFSDSLTDEQREVLKIMTQMGVMMNARVKPLLDLPVEYVREKALEMRGRGLGRGYAGLFIRTLEDLVPVLDAELAEKQRREEELDALRDSSRRYSSSLFSDFLAGDDPAGVE